MPVDHYENFPVASWLLPARLRAPVEAIYAFARGADDIADEGDATDAERLAGLAAYSRALDAIEAGATPAEAPFERLAHAIRAHALPIGLLRDLIDAFSQDVVKKRYRDYGELLDYSRRSANPVGRLLLHLFRRTDAESLARSDAICSALQFINFWQDVAVDWPKGRVYIPQEDLARFGVSEAAIAAGDGGGAWPALMAFQCTRSRELLRSGAPLGRTLPGRMGLEIRAVVAGGTRILDKIDAARGDVFRHRPILGKGDWARILGRALLRL
ncbi:squalene synthase HpnC [Betaproteobacteria bacterium GR16-43]|nr:squalene synthase HpnC [Betaproteobacteria bacterium GR16-43]